MCAPFVCQPALFAYNKYICLYEFVRTARAVHRLNTCKISWHSSDRCDAIIDVLSIVVTRFLHHEGLDLLHSACTVIDAMKLISSFQRHMLANSRWLRSDVRSEQCDQSELQHQHAHAQQTPAAHTQT